MRYFFIFLLAFISLNSVWADFSCLPEEHECATMTQPMNFYESCVRNLKNKTNLAMGECAQKIYKQYEGRFKYIYTELSKKLSQNRKLSLKKTQKLWLKYRDQHCSFRCLYKGHGSISQVNYPLCLLKLTTEREVLLAKHLGECEEYQDGCF